MAPLLNVIYETPMATSDRIMWTDEGAKAFCHLKHAWAGMTVLALPNYGKPLVQTVDCNNGHMNSVKTCQ